MTYWECHRSQATRFASLRSSAVWGRWEHVSRSPGESVQAVLPGASANSHWRNHKTTRHRRCIRFILRAVTQLEPVVAITGKVLRFIFKHLNNKCRRVLSPWQFSLKPSRVCMLNCLCERCHVDQDTQRSTGPKTSWVRLNWNCVTIPGTDQHLDLDHSKHVQCENHCCCVVFVDLPKLFFMYLPTLSTYDPCYRLRQQFLESCSHSLIYSMVATWFVLLLNPRDLCWLF